MEWICDFTSKYNMRGGQATLSKTIQSPLFESGITATYRCYSNYNGFYLTILTLVVVFLIQILVLLYYRCILGKQCVF